jgi:Zn-dependent peptidase ImmA (M78 family)/DNA-binding XRE family transcriptional regulator
MSKNYQAFIKPELLVWARSIAHLDIEQVARKLHVKADKIHAWETGRARPTVKQLRQLAKIYNQTFAAFYLPSPPGDTVPIPHDYRRHAGTILVGISPELALDIRTSWERRSIVLDLYTEQETPPIEFTPTIELVTDPEETALQIRNLLGIDYEKQKGWQDARIAFNAIREAIETVGVLVFQSTSIPIEEIRGYSLSLNPLPVIVVNRKEKSYSARSFTMLHELTHIMLQVGGLCDLTTEEGKKPEEIRVEVFCNHVAGATLIPKDLFLNEPIVQAHGTSLLWGDEEIEALSKTYCASREVVVRRLLVLGLTTPRFYETKRQEYQEKLKKSPKGKGFVSPPRDVVSTSGKPYIRTILDALYSERITTSDVVDYLGVKSKHLEQIADIVGAEF